ncbi:MAG: DNA-binding GntR family transcriptional regulator [Paracoccaceae bacterium]|jgi:DNA-binding GntR family transcriptional regulator
MLSRQSSYDLEFSHMDDPTDGKVGDTALALIRNDIVFGRLQPDQRLTLDKLRVSYGVSISTLREVLSRLAAEDLVAAEGNKGFRVAPVSDTDLHDIADLRLVLERHALALSFQKGDLDWEGRIVSAHHKLAAIERRLLAGETVNQQLWKRFDWEFHQALISACGSAHLMRAHAAAFDKYLRYQMIAMRFRGAVAAEEHAGLEAAAMDRDIDCAQDLLARHIAGGVDVAMAGAQIR